MIYLSLPQIFEGSGLKGSPSFVIDSRVWGLCLDLTVRWTVARSMVSNNHWLRGIETYTFLWQLILLSTNQALSNSGEMFSLVVDHVNVKYFQVKFLWGKILNILQQFHEQMSLKTLLMVLSLKTFVAVGWTLGRFHCIDTERNENFLTIKV